MVTVSYRKYLVLGFPRCLLPVDRRAHVGSFSQRGLPELPQSCAPYLGLIQPLSLQSLQPRLHQLQLPVYHYSHCHFSHCSPGYMRYSCHCSGVAYTGGRVASSQGGARRQHCSLSGCCTLAAGSLLYSGCWLLAQSSVDCHQGRRGKLEPGGEKVLNC